jgi:hypothetical protein
MIPGIKPSDVQPILINRSWPQPRSNNTQSGGKTKATINLKTLIQEVRAMLSMFFDVSESTIGMSIVTIIEELVYSAVFTDRLVPITQLPGEE